MKDRKGTYAGRLTGGGGGGCGGRKDVRWRTYIRAWGRSQKCLLCIRTKKANMRTLPPRHETGVKNLTAQDDKRTWTMTGYSIPRSPNRKIRRLPTKPRLTASPAFIVQSLFFGSFISTLCPSELVPGNKATKHAATPVNTYSSPNAPGPGIYHSFVILLQTGTRVQSAENINKNCNTAELHTNRQPG